MGCTTSRVVNDGTVRRCKERRRLMKEAVHSRHQLAASHSDYLRSLRLVGSALSYFSSFLSFSVSGHSSLPALLRPVPPPPSTAASSPLPSSLFSASSLGKGTTTVKKKKSSAGISFSTYTSTPSQSSSSAWNWEDHYPPSPPRSEFFDSLDARRRQQQQEVEEYRHNMRHDLPEEEHDDVEVEEEVHYGRSSTSSTTKSDIIENVDETTAKSDIYESSAASVDHLFYRNKATPTSRPSRDDGGAGVVKMVVCHTTLKELSAEIEENFVKAASAGEGISELLESGRARLDRSFRRLKKTVYHSSGVLSNLSSTWTSKPPLAVRYHLDTAAMVDSSEKKSHCSTLEQLLAWEDKLYQEVKAREGVKIEHEKKLSAFQNQEYKGENDVKLNKTKTSINKLHSLILVTSQAVSTTSSAIIKVRDDELSPQLVELCCGFQQMWRSMNQFHEVQNHIVQQVHGLVSNSSSLESTSEQYHQATSDLESAVLDWHSSFTRLIKFHRSYIQALCAWLKLTFFQVSTDKSEKDHCSTVASSALSTLCDEWKQALDRLPDTVAAEAIKSFASVIHSISMKQEEELKIKKRVEAYSKELEKKISYLRGIERKFYQSYSMVGFGIQNLGEIDNRGQVIDAEDPLAQKKAEIAAFRRKVDDEIARHTKAVKVARDMTLNNIQTGLPGVFHAITGFSGLSAVAFEGVCQQTGACK